MFYGFGEYLYLRPRGFQVDYAVELNVSPPPAGDFGEPLIVGPMQQVDPTSSSGFRAGFGGYFSPCERLEVTYTDFDSDDADSFESLPSGDPTSRLQALVVGQKDNEDWDTANAQLNVQLRTLDIDYRRLDSCCCVEWLLGVRLGQLKQELHANYSQFDAGFRNGWSNIEFEGVGLRLGLIKEYRRPCSSFFLYYRGTASFLAGEFQADFLQTSDDAEPADPPIESQTSWESARIVPVLDLEVGIGWEPPSGMWRVSAGYLISAWTNIVKMDEFNTAIRSQELDDVSDTATFDGLAVRGEIRF
jgi:hypothetical protein